MVETAHADGLCPAFRSDAEALLRTRFTKTFRVSRHGTCQVCGVKDAGLNGSRWCLDCHQCYAAWARIWQKIGVPGGCPEHIAEERIHLYGLLARDRLPLEWPHGYL